MRELTGWTSSSGLGVQRMLTGWQRSNELEFHHEYLAHAASVELAIDGSASVATDGFNGEHEVTAAVKELCNNCRISSYMDLHRDSSMVVHLC